MSPDRFTTLTVSLGARSYPILIGEQLLSRAGELLAPHLPLKRVFIITDEHVAKAHLPTLQAALSGTGIRYEAIILPPGEQTKSFAMFESVLTEILSHKPERKVTLIALGGGVIGDLTGFAASALLRGVGFIQIPTTLLSQVDSSVGGKTGINSKHGKNLIGSFYQPQLVLADMSLLDTLPKRELLAGYAEVVKYGLINQPEFFDWLVSQEAAFNRGDKAILSRMVETSCQAKAEIVAADEHEGGVRALLNLGHTFGHALEKVMGYDGRLLHGEAVAIGMMQAFRFSSRLGLCSESDVQRVEKHLKAVGLPTGLYDIHDRWNANDLLEAMYQDKKVSAGTLTFILAKGIGKAFIAKDVDPVSVRTMLEEEIG
jgi:3-dehydroquinate synthase